ncbi:hypothetical protein AZE42_09560, partial [Rhizopogon vesiculosus]
SLHTGECWIPGVIGYLDTTATTRLLVVYCLLVVAELEILLFLLYPAIKRDGLGIDNRFMRGLIQHNLLYFCCSFAFSLSVILALVFLPLYSHSRRVDYLFSNSYQVVLQNILVVRMHRDFWKSDRPPRDTDEQISLTTFMARIPDLV